MQKAKRNLLLITTFLTGVFFVCLPAVLAQSVNDYGLSKTAQTAGLDTSVKEIPVLVGGLLGVGLSLIAIMFFVLILYGGFLWMVDLGNEDRKKRGQQVITGAIVGIIFTFSAYTIANFVFTTVTPGSPAPGGQGGGPGGPPSTYCCVHPSRFGEDTALIVNSISACLASCENEMGSCDESNYTALPVGQEPVLTEAECQ